MVGCGNSNLPYDLKSQGFKNVVGMDYSKSLDPLGVWGSGRSSG